MRCCGLYVESSAFVYNCLSIQNISHKKINFLYPLDDMSAIHSWIQAEHSQRQDLIISNTVVDVSDIYIVKMPWEMERTDAKVDNTNTDSCVSVAFFLRHSIWICKLLRFNSFLLIHLNRPLPIHSYSLAPISSPDIDNTGEM